MKRVGGSALELKQGLTLGWSFATHQRKAQPGEPPRSAQKCFILDSRQPPSPEWAESKLVVVTEQRLAPRWDRFQKPREPGFIAGAPPQRKVWATCVNVQCVSVESVFGINECELGNVYALIPHDSFATLPLCDLCSHFSRWPLLFSEFPTTGGAPGLLKSETEKRQ